MERSLLKELNKKTLEAYINRAREAWYQRMFWNRFFGLKYTTQLTWESLTGSGGTPVMADVVQYNASAPLKSRRTLTKTSGDIPKIAIKRRMDEKDYNDYVTMKALAMGDANKSALLDLVFGDVDFCYTGVMARTEFLCLQALSYGSLALTDDNNIGIVTETTVDFGIPSGNKKAATTAKWETAATALPLTDIRYMADLARANGHILTNIVMDLTTFNLMVATTEVKNTFAAFRGYSSATKQFLGLADVNLFLSTHMLPTIQVVDSSVRFESTAGALSTVAPWKTGYVAFLTSPRIGNVMHGPIAVEQAESVKKKAIMTKRDHALIYKFSELEPFAEFTVGQANAFPTFNDVDAIYLMYVNDTTWA